MVKRICLTLILAALAACAAEEEVVMVEPEPIMEAPANAPDSADTIVAELSALDASDPGDLRRAEEIQGEILLRPDFSEVLAGVIENNPEIASVLSDIPTATVRCGLGCRLRNLFSGDENDDGFDGLPEKVAASRAFAVHDDDAEDALDPAAFAGYGIIYFPDSISRGPSSVRARMICQAFRQLPTVRDLETPPESVPRSEQFVTAWPVRSFDALEAIRSAEAQELAAVGADDEDAEKRAAGRVCGAAVANYDRGEAIRAQRDAGESAAFTGQGPYLLAWAPRSEKGADALVLSLDMSQVQDLEDARRDFRLWKTLIEGDRSLWGDGFSLPQLTLALRRWVDGTSSSVLKLLS